LKTDVLEQGRRGTKFMVLRISIQYTHVLLDNDGEDKVRL
jgi:hypothetical protein